MFSCYRKDEAHDPDVYCAAVAATLAEFPRPVVDYVTDPRTGMPSSSRFLPNIAEVREACVMEAERRRKLSQPRVILKREAPPAKPPGDLFVAFDVPRYADMSERLNREPDKGRRDKGGIWIPHVWYERERETPAQRMAAPAESQP
jgi:hypothetical protein